MKKRVIGSIVLLTGILVALFLSSDRNRASFGQNGYIETGKKFGLSIGDNRDRVFSHFESLKITTDSQNKLSGKKCLGKDFKEFDVVEHWDDNSWRRGTICVAYMDDNVKAIKWRYGFMDP